MSWKNWLKLHKRKKLLLALTLIFAVTVIFISYSVWNNLYFFAKQTNQTPILVKSDKQVYTFNQLVSEMIKVEIKNNSNKAIFFNPSSYACSYISICKQEKLGCKKPPPELSAMTCDPFEKLYPNQKKTLVTTSPKETGTHRLVFSYTDESNLVNFRFTDKNLEETFSQEFTTHQVPNTKQASEEICKSWEDYKKLTGEIRDIEPCFNDILLTFGTKQNPISAEAFEYKAKDFLSETFFVKAKIEIGYPPNSFPEPLTYTTYAKLTRTEDDPPFGPYSQIFLKENGQFIFCTQPESQPDSCKGWKNNATYLIEGIARKGKVIPEWDEKSLYLEVISKQILPTVSQ